MNAARSLPGSHEPRRATRRAALRALRLCAITLAACTCDAGDEPPVPSTTQPASDGGTQRTDASRSRDARVDVDEDDAGSECNNADDPAQGQGSSSEPAYTRMLTAYRMYSECGGSCGYKITFDYPPDRLTTACTRVRLGVYVAENDPDYGHEAFGRLTPLGHDKLRSIADKLENAKLQTTYGCPSCVNEPFVVIELLREGVWSSHEYAANHAPSVLAPADNFVDKIHGALEHCTKSTYVVPDADCKR